MVINCKVINCNSEQHKGSNLSFHRFPVNDPELLKCWLENIGLSNWSPKRQDSICSLHFADNQFINTKPRRLVKNAVPTIFAANIEKHGPENPVIKDEVNPVAQLDVMDKIDELNSNGMSTELSVSSFSDNEMPQQEEFSKSNKRSSKIKFHNPRFPGDFNENDLRSPERMKKMWELANKQITEQRKKLKTLQQKNRRLECQVIRLKNLVKHLKTVHH